MSSPDTKALKILGRPKALIFDWDNTLVNTWPAIHDALNHTLIEMGHPAWTFEETRQRVRKSMRDSFPDLFGDMWEKAGEIFYARFELSHIERLEAIEGAETLLESLYANDYHLSIVSNKTGKYLREEVTHLGWEKYFQAILGAGDCTHDKPHIAPLEKALEGSAIPLGTQVWFVGDTDVDLECANNAGCPGILLRNTPPEKGEFDETPPSWYFKSCMALQATLDKEGG